MKKQYLIFIFFITHLISAQNFTDTKGELQISNSGSATYNLPIAMPPSIKSVAPIINLTYSSGVRGGIAGQGWNINSISTISRMATRRDIDGFVDGVDFDDNDKLALDGQRLLLKTGTYWADGSTYETEYKSNTKIELKIENGGASTFFIVTSPDGSRTWYGSKGSGTYQNATSVNAWFIVRFEDANGNNIEYNYANVVYNSTNQLYIDNITFSANQVVGIAAQDKIIFTYRDAKRVERDYIKGGPVYATKILDNIQVLANNAPFRKYQLFQTPDLDSGYERVTKIQESNGQNEASNPVIFEYNTPTPTTTNRKIKDYTNNLNFNETDLAGDFDGDGRLDFVANNQIFTNLFNESSGNAPINLPFTGNKRQEFVATTLTSNKLNQFQSIVYANETLNSIEFKIHNLTSGNVITLSNTKTINFDNSIYHDTSSETYSFFGCNPPPLIKVSNEYLEGDFNGDGISEVLLCSTINERYYNYYANIVNDEGDYESNACVTEVKSDGKESYLLNLDPNASTILGGSGFVKLQNTIVLQGDKKFVVDFNSDGKSDILIVNNDKTYKIVSFKQLNVSPWVELELIGSGTLDKYSPTKQILFGDYNGDGKTDIMLPDTEGGINNTLWHTYYSNPKPAGGDFFVKESQNIVEYWPNTGTYYSTQTDISSYYAMDVNGDGKSDLVRVWRKYYKPQWTINNHNTQWRVTAFTNNIGKISSSGFIQTYDSGIFDSPSPDIPIPITSNYKYQGANTELVIVRGHYNKIEYYQFNKDFDTDNRLIHVKESNGKIIQVIEYKPMEAIGGGLGNVATDFYSSSNTSIYPNIEIIRNTGSFLVSKLTAIINNVYKYQDFKYYGYVSNFNYGTVGFKRISRSSWYLPSSTDPKIWTTYNNDINLRGANTITWSSTNPETVFATIPDNLLSTKTNYFATYTQGTSMSSSNGQNDIVITDPVTINQTYIANNSITASSVVNDGVIANYKAPQIILKPGFSAKPSSTGEFRAVPVAAGSSATIPKNYVYNVLLTKQTTKDHLSGVISETSFTYDGSVNSDNYFGLQTQSVAKQYSGTTLQGTTTSSTTYENNPTGSGAAYYIGRPKTVNTSTTIYTGDTRTSSEVYTYSGSNLSKTEKTGHKTYPIVEDMTYDAVGNLLTKTVSAPSAPTPIAARTITDEYDATKRFVVKKKDHQLFETNFVYNTLGQVTQSTNYLGVVSDYIFDNWGKLKNSKTTGASTIPLETTITYVKLSDGGYTTTSQNTVGDQAKSITQYDVLGRAIVSTTKGFALNSTISKQVVYDGLGRKQKESEPYFSFPSKWTSYEYDYLQRPTKITTSTGRIQTLSYSGLTTTSIDDVKTTTATVDALGNKTQTTDEGGTINFTYYATGQLKESNYEGHKVSISIDGWGNKIAMNDPNAGNYTYGYDAFGQITKETTPKGYTDTTYDVFGRVLKKKISGDGADFETDYVYNSFSQLISETSKKAIGTPIDSFTYGYDNLHRLETTTESNASFTHTKTVSYDTFGRPITGTNATQELTTGLSTSITTKNNYNAYNGIMDKMTDANDNVLWQLNTANEKMKSLTETLGNGVTITNAYNADGYYTSQKHSKNSVDVLYNTYDFNAVKGTLNNRQNQVLGTNEVFTYDTLDRLIQWTNPLTNSQDSNGYDTRGRITNNNKLGTVNYNTDTTTGIYRKKSINLTTDGVGYYNNLPKQVVSYTMFKSPISINESDKGSTAFVYNSHLSRQTMQYGYQPNPGATGIYTKTKSYTDDGSVEILKTPTTITIRTYIGGDAYTAPLYIDKVKTLNTGAIVDKKQYLHRDYLGSIIAISDDTGVAVERRQFDAWGNLAKLQQNGIAIALPTDGTAAGLMMLDRGYTGHEHLAEVGLIQMNGRLYDPTLRSFLMPDNFIQQPENTQNYNRYAYVLNNPLMYTDPSGEEFISLGVAVIIGAAIALTTYTMTALLTDVPFTVGGLAKATFIGAASAAVTFGIGTAAGNLFTNFFSKAAFQAVAHGTFQGTMSGLQGGNFWSGFAAGALSSIASSLYSGGSSMDGLGKNAHAIPGTGLNSIGDNLGGAGMIAFGTVAGGVGAKLTGGNFWQGAATGLVVSGLNHLAHQQPDPNKELARRIAKQYGGNAGEIREWLDNHPFELTHEGVKFKGLDLEAKYINEPGTNVKNAINQAPQMVAEELGTKALEFIFRGGPVGQLLSDGGLANTPSPSDIAQRQIRIEGAKNALIRHVFMPQGQQTPSMSNGFNPYSGYSRYNLFYKVK
ncbi:RHS repeat-associated core domain-containing protein [Flavobacterium sp. XS2P12]|uniref:RHS repeat-associated core domain-containing protein n=1 Tax=Flavobacterium melibiosi TaxID=3398734 RepID=UPI003A8C5E66